MTPSFAISLSGMEAASTRLAVASSNIVNARSAGDAGAEGLHIPMRVEQSAEPGGGTKATLVAVVPATMPVFAPDDPRADENGAVAYPNVSLAQQFVEMKLAKIAYAANIAALKVSDEMLGELLDIAS